ncbi:MAG TPA: hypothetical protein VNI83_13295, partial [Vicinamibacterales bacterium]|nr:hypothetical protein [Vicinamibacterales bacterium]
MEEITAVSSATPAMRQYLEAKRQHPDAILFFRMGDFYEMFYEDALVAARALDLTLTSRTKDDQGGGIPMCGVPHQAADAYIARLVRKGFRVAICEQVEDPRKARGLVRREVVRVVSPGTLVDAGYLEAREPAFLMAIAPGDGPAWGVALLDLSTGEFSAAEYRAAAGRAALADELAVLRPRELLVPAGAGAPGGWLPAVRPSNGADEGPRVTEADPWTFEHEAARRALLDQLGVQSLAAFGLERHPLAVRAAGALVQYLRETQKAQLAHVRSIVFRTGGDALVIDPTTLRHLEVVEGAGGGRAGSLLEVLDRTVTAMGSRLLRSWLLRPPAVIERIQDRLDAVEELAFRATERAKLREVFRHVQDLERLVARAALGTAGPRELAAIGTSLDAVPRARAIAGGCQAPLVRSLAAALDDLAELRARIAATLVDDPPATARDGG